MDCSCPVWRYRVLLKPDMRHIATYILIFMVSNFFSLQYAFADSVNLDIGKVQLKTKTDQEQFQITATPETVVEINPVINEIKSLDKLTTGIYIYSSNSLLAFEDISPTNPQLRQTTLNISPSGSLNFGLYLYEDSLLENDTKSATIPATTCDNGDCNSESSDTWNNTLTYGYGYQCLECPTFDGASEYKQIPVDQKKMSLLTNLTSKNQIYNIIYKINVASSQPKISYASSVTYVLLPEL